MGAILAKRLNLGFHFALVVDEIRDMAHARIQVPYVTWDKLTAWPGNHTNS